MLIERRKNSLLYFLNRSEAVNRVIPGEKLFHWGDLDESRQLLLSAINAIMSEHEKKGIDMGFLESSLTLYLSLDVPNFLME